MVEVVERHPGRSMSGIFGAGYLLYAEKHPEFRQIVKPKRFDCSSAGAINVAHALSEQVTEGIKLYTHYMPGNFIFPRKIIPGIAQRAWNRLVYEVELRGVRGLKQIPRDKLLMPVDIDYLFDTMQLDLDKIEKNEIPFVVRVYNPLRGETIFKDGKKETLRILRETVSLMPYYVPPSGWTHIDPDMRGTIGLDSLLEMYPNDKIVIVLNHKPMRYPYHYVFQFMEGGVTSLMVPGNSLGVWNDFNGKAGRFMEDIRKLREMERNREALLVYPRKEPLPRNARDRRVFWVHPSERSRTKANNCGEGDRAALQERGIDGERAAEAVYNLFR